MFKDCNSFIFIESIEKACSSDFVVFDKNWDGFPSDVHHILSKLNKELKKLQLIEHEVIMKFNLNIYENIIVIILYTLLL